ncbi:DUF58 domain-containing protein [Planococcus sp. CAU13]|uniref:DUF58 domain-containing protein n=1 Tax=Planococcus sp. CAU13 TaxID=1541197 RepID=UPI00052FE675|nr:DUF58 domain-containing protein [Planococcus sp. CAU13]
MKRIKKALSSWGRIIFVVFILLLTFSFAMFQGGFVSWFIFYMALPFVLYSLLLNFYSLKNIEMKREIHTTQIRKGQKFSATVHFNRTSSFPLLYTVLTEKTNSIALRKRNPEDNRTLFMPGFKKSHTWHYEIGDMPRGEHVLEGIELEIADFFGWTKKTKLFPLRQTILVYPNTVDIPYRALESSYDQGAMAAPHTLVKDTTMATGIRDYQPGDRVSWIHWKSFARTQTLRTKEFEDRQSEDLFLLDDRKPSDKFEMQVELTASLLQSIVRGNSSVAYLSIGNTADSFPVIHSESHLQHIMYHLTKVLSDLDRPVEEAAGRELQQIRATTLIYITTKLTVEMVEAIRRNVKNLNICMCLVLTNKGEKLAKADEAAIQFAGSKGFIVKLVTPENFTSVFTEVSRK